MENIPYSSAIGSVMYSMISTRPDLSFAISLLSRFMSNPGIEHWVALKWTLRYINTTMHVGLEYCKRTLALDLVGYVDSDFGGDRDSRKSTTAYYFTLGGNCISWKSQLQPLVSLSITEADQSAIHLSKNPVYHERMKHVDVKYHFVRDQISKGTVNLLKIPTEENPSDMGTKVVIAVKFKHYLNILHIN
ncbi:secreted RxLR effector protein 161-like [Pistacia vera]|uniref:secreted RxLR effector protein 161-like n=1 Tax=Pistacia vera TaxID=55513 RepID=UPI0012632426|nr:secreted RxLR effector protein 161-like [Pistacia vera]